MKHHIRISISLSFTEGAKTHNPTSAVRALYMGGMHLKEARKLVARAQEGETAEAFFEAMTPPERIARELDACGFEGLFGVERKKATVHTAAHPVVRPCVPAE